jgi:hypothetical protein
LISRHKKECGAVPDSYEQFLALKSNTMPPLGIEHPPRLSPKLKPFQCDITLWALRRGRAALFQGTGTGKTFEQLSWARAVADHTKGRVLILAPLGVAFQTVEEATKWEINSVAFAQQGWMAKSDIVITNYDRRDSFDLGEFAGIVLDESSIIKSDDSATRKELIERAQCVQYRLCCTATPAPNDWTELGNHAEFLGVMTAKEMLAMYFVHDGAIRASGPDVEEWRLKRHATKAFWKWVASWAIMLRDPNLFGYDEPDYRLPPLRMHQVTVKTNYEPSLDGLFATEANTLGERIGVRRETIAERVSAAASIVDTFPDAPWLIWCGLNKEGDELERLINNSIQVQGSDEPALKEERLLGFANGKYQRLISKPKIAGFGMNFQRCSKMIFCGLNDSFEQLFQAIRRCWRFGQNSPVDVYMIASEREGAVVANLRRKEEKYEAMAAAMESEMQEFCIEQLRTHDKSGRLVRTANQDMELPSWLIET